MSHPYVPLGTPVTITVDGFWDGDHNGNQPFIVVPNGQGENKKFYVPHGALVQTKPEEAEAVEFTVDKTPARPETVAPGTVDELFGDRATVSSADLREYLGQPKLRTMKDCDGDRWSEVAPDVWYDHPPASLRELEEQLGPLTDVTDTGEPLDAETDYVPMSYEEAEYWGRMDDSDEKKDTPRKPEPGDRVRGVLVVEGTYMTPGGIQEDSGNQVWGFENAEVTVIAPARPVVPEEPAGDVVVMDEATTQYVWDERPDCFDDLHWRAEDGTHYTWEALWEKFGPLYKVERGPVIGGE